MCLVLHVATFAGFFLQNIHVVDFSGLLRFCHLFYVVTLHPLSMYDLFTLDVSDLLFQHVFANLLPDEIGVGLSLHC